MKGFFLWPVTPVAARLRALLPALGTLLRQVLAVSAVQTALVAAMLGAAPAPLSQLFVSYCSNLLAQAPQHRSISPTPER